MENAIITDSFTMQNVDALLHNLKNVQARYSENVVSDDIAKDLMSEDMTEICEVVLTQLHAIEILECVVYSNATPMRTYVVQHHKLNECLYGFDMLKRDTIEKTTIYHFETAREAFSMLAQIIAI